jgi:hypothetical protein
VTWFNRQHFYCFYPCTSKFSQIRSYLFYRYAIVDVTAENAYVVTLKLSSCLDEFDCLFDETVLDNQMIKKETCHWEDYSLPSGTVMCIQ